MHTVHRTVFLAVLASRMRKIFHERCKVWRCIIHIIIATIPLRSIPIINAHVVQYHGGIHHERHHGMRALLQTRHLDFHIPNTCSTNILVELKQKLDHRCLSVIVHTG